jgi:hypothetical protein
MSAAMSVTGSARCAMGKKKFRYQGGLSIYRYPVTGTFQGCWATPPPPIGGLGILICTTLAENITSVQYK